MIRLTRFSYAAWEPQMQLKKLTYSELEESPLPWSFDNMSLGSINLIVSRNAVGKTRIATVINGLAHKLLRGGKLPIVDGCYDLSFDHNGKEIRYQVDIQKQQTLKENYFYHGNHWLTRDSTGAGKIWTAEVKQMLNFKNPTDELVATDRDVVQHGFLTPLQAWADSVHFYRFSTDLGMTQPAIPAPGGLPFDPQNKALAVDAFRSGHGKFPDFKAAIIADMAKLDYFIEDIDVGPPSSYVRVAEMAPNITTLPPPEILNTLQLLNVKEQGLGAPLDQGQLSTGMWRCLSLVIQVNYHALTSTPQCLLIDDVGEGLDYDRSCALAKLLMEKAEKTNVQLIMTTNDRFIMNSVPLKYWTVLERKGNVVEFFNQSSHPKAFEEFKYTGLNNFDFFQMRFAQGDDQSHA